MPFKRSFSLLAFVMTSLLSVCAMAEDIWVSTNAEYCYYDGSELVGEGTYYWKGGTITSPTKMWNATASAWVSVGNSLACYSPAGTITVSSQTDDGDDNGDGIANINDPTYPGYDPDAATPEEYDPESWDQDWDEDGYSNAHEIALGTDPQDSASYPVYDSESATQDWDLDDEPNLTDLDDDNDGYTDGVEIRLGTDPTDSESVPVYDPDSTEQDWDGDGDPNATDDNDDFDDILDTEDDDPTTGLVIGDDSGGIDIVVGGDDDEEDEDETQGSTTDEEEGDTSNNDEENSGDSTESGEGEGEEGDGDGNDENTSDITGITNPYSYTETTDIGLSDNRSAFSECMTALGLSMSDIEAEASNYTTTIDIPIGGTLDNIRYKTISFSLDPDDMPDSQSTARTILKTIQSIILTLMKCAIGILFFKSTSKLCWEL